MPQINWELFDGIEFKKENPEWAMFKSIREVEHADEILNHYPKSGTTWLDFIKSKTINDLPLTAVVDLEHVRIHITEDNEDQLTDLNLRHLGYFCQSDNDTVTPSITRYYCGLFTQISFKDSFYELSLEEVQAQEMAIVEEFYSKEVFRETASKFYFLEEALSSRIHAYPEIASMHVKDRAAYSDCEFMIFGDLAKVLINEWSVFNREINRFMIIEPPYTGPHDQHLVIDLPTCLGFFPHEYGRPIKPLEKAFTVLTAVNGVPYRFGIMVHRHELNPSDRRNCEKVGAFLTKLLTHLDPTIFTSGKLKPLKVV